jgi:hypothetical protein
MFQARWRNGVRCRVIALFIAGSSGGNGRGDRIYPNHFPQPIPPPTGGQDGEGGFTRRFRFSLTEDCDNH